MLNNEQPELILLVGIPGSGKSTYIKKLISEDKNYVIISTDDIVEEEAARLGKTYSEIWKDTIKSATARAKEKFRQAIAERRNVIWDQTNLSADKRKAILGQLPDNYYKSAVLFNTPLDVVKERVLNRARETGKHIPMQVVDDMHQRMEIPTKDEGFDEIEVIGEV